MLAMPAEGRTAPPPRQCLERLLPMAGFQVSIYGRFWVSTEECHRGVDRVVGLPREFDGHVVPERADDGSIDFLLRTTRLICHVGPTGHQNPVSIRADLDGSRRLRPLGRINVGVAQGVAPGAAGPGAGAGA